MRAAGAFNRPDFAPTLRAAVFCGRSVARRGFPIAGLLAAHHAMHSIPQGLLRDPWKVANVLLRVKRRLEPLHRILHQHHVKPARWRGRQAQQVVPCCKNDALLLGLADAAACAPKRTAGAAAHLHKHQRAVPVPHHQINLAPTAPWRPIIAHRQLQSGRLQMRQRRVFCRIAALSGGGDISPWRRPWPGGGCQCDGRFSLFKEFH